jgi:16S rRNA (cytidine1402-2'-O)-methyltransferase
MLYVVSTPIGNLADITFRAITTLKNCDYILCEDTRHSLPLLHHYEIRKPLISFHKFTESTKQQTIVEDLKKGSVIGLISDAGTPGISDPGGKLIQECLEQGIKVISIPGASACIAALSCSGLETDRFQFCGFLPRKTAELKRTLQELLSYPGTTICYESPKRLLNTLECLSALASNRLIVVARELTKQFEETRRGTAQELINHWKEKEVRGEIVLMISGQKDNSLQEWQNLSIEEHVELMQSSYKLTKQEAIIYVAKIRGVKKRDIYNKMCSSSVQKPL